MKNIIKLYVGAFAAGVFTLFLYAAIDKLSHAAGDCDVASGKDQ